MIGAVAIGAVGADDAGGWTATVGRLVGARFGGVLRCGLRVAGAWRAAGEEVRAGPKQTLETPAPAPATHTATAALTAKPPPITDPPAAAGALGSLAPPRPARPTSRCRAPWTTREIATHGGLVAAEITGMGSSAAQPRPARRVADTCCSQAGQAWRWASARSRWKASDVPAAKAWRSPARRAQRSPRSASSMRMRSFASARRAMLLYASTLHPNRSSISARGVPRAKHTAKRRSLALRSRATSASSAAVNRRWSSTSGDRRPVGARSMASGGAEGRCRSSTSWRRCRSVTREARRCSRARSACASEAKRLPLRAAWHSSVTACQKQSSTSSSQHTRERNRRTMRSRRSAARRARSSAASRPSHAAAGSDRCVRFVGMDTQSLLRAPTIMGVIIAQTDALLRPYASEARYS